MKKIIITALLGLCFTLLSEDVRETMRVVLVHRRCDQMIPLIKDNTNIVSRCTGEMKLVAGSGTLTSYPPQYQHSCTVCGATRNYFEVFPKIEYEPMPSGTNLVRQIAPEKYILVTNGMLIIK